MTESGTEQYGRIDALRCETPGAGFETCAFAGKGGVNYGIHGEARHVAHDRVDVVQSDLALAMGIKHELGKLATGGETVAAEARDQGRSGLALNGKTVGLQGFVDDGAEIATRIGVAGQGESLL